MSRKSIAAPPSRFRCFNSSPDVIRLVVIVYVKYPLSLRNVEDLLAERGIDICHETVRFRWNRFGPMFAAEIRRKRVDHMRAYAENAYNSPRVATVTLIGIQIVRKFADQTGFVVHPRRWVVERTFASFNRNRRLAKDFEHTLRSATAFLYAAAAMLLIRRLGRCA